MKYSIILFFTLTSQICIGQNWVNGRVVDSLEMPINNATIQIRLKNTDKLLSILSTDIQGNFKYFLNDTAKIQEIYKIIISHISYSIKSTEIEGIVWKSKDLKIYLDKKKQTLLQEVIVKSMPIYTNEDTTTYRVKAFIDGTEKTLEDVAKKLPGVIVNEDGSIIYKGKRLTKILIEGEDLLSNKTKLLSKNFPADLLDNIQLIENYSDNVLLKGFNQGDQSVMNLKLGKRKLKVAFGELGTSIGIQKRQDYNIVLFSLLNKIKSATISNYNNVGKDNIQSAGLNIDGDEISQKISNFNYQEIVNLPINTIRPFRASLPLPTQRWFFNNQLNLTNQTNFKISEKITTKLLFNYQSDNSSLNTNKNSLFFQQQNNYLIIDTVNSLYSPQRLKLKLQTDIQISSKKQGRLILQFENDKTQYDNTQKNNQFNIISSNIGHLKNKFNSGFFLYDYTFRKSENIIILNNLYLNLKDLPQEYSITSNRFSNSLIGTNDYNQAIQKNIFREFILGNQFQVLKKIKGKVISTFLNIQFEKTQRNNLLILNSIVKDTTYQPSVQLDRNSIRKLLSGFQITHKFSKSKFVNCFELGGLQWINTANNINKTQFSFIGNIKSTLQQKLNKNISFNLSLSYERLYNNNHLLNDSIAVVSNNELISFSTSSLITTKYSSNYSIFYISPKLLLVTINGGFSFQPNGFVASNTFNNSINFVKNNFINKSNSLNYISIQARAPIINLKSRIEISANYLNQKLPFFENINEYSIFISKSLTSDIKFTTVFKSKFNADFTFRYLYSSSFRINYNLPFNKFDNISLVYLPRINYKYYKTNTFSILGNYYNLNLNNNPLNLYFVDAELNFFHIKHKLNFELAIRNLLNYKTYNQFMTSPLFQSNTNYNLYGRSIDFGVKLKL